jgi:hypothetical protein
MERSYSSFGLALRSSFPLAGMRPIDVDGLPSVELAMEAPAELLAAWRGVDGGGWRGQLSDGNELSIERGPAGLLFSYGDSAWFLFDSARGRLGCASADPASLDWQRVLLDRVLPLVSVAVGREALHSAAVETPLGVVAIAASSGTGKSTLAAELTRRGHRFFCDDILILDGGGGAVAHPGAPHMNLDLPATSAAALQLPAFASTLGILAGEAWVEVGSRAAREPREVVAIVLLERAAGLTLQARRLPVSPLTLVPFMLGLPDEARDAATFAVYSDLVDSAVLLRLSGGADDSPADFAAALEDAIGLDVAAAEGILA